MPNERGTILFSRTPADAYDRHFGDGTGEAFFMGPYLDALPAAVSTLAVDRKN